MGVEFTKRGDGKVRIEKPTFPKLKKFLLNHSQGSHPMKRPLPCSEKGHRKEGKIRFLVVAASGTKLGRDLGLRVVEAQALPLYRNMKSSSRK